jgi:rSAM/selenodomain-associated transferase 2
MHISIIIPTYNEAESIGTLINYLQQYSAKNVIELIVTDAGSTDNTLLTAQQAGAIAVVAPQKGRAAQMHYGASLAKGSVLYFVHADTYPPPTYATDISEAVNKGYSIGRYQTKFNSNKWYLKINAWFTRFDWFICMGGDQTLFITTALYQSSGGFNTSMQIMEEYEFATRARRNNKYKIFNTATLVSARKYDTNSWWQVQQANKKIVAMYKKGATQQEMVTTYKKMLRYR